MPPGNYLNGEHGKMVIEEMEKYFGGFLYPHIPDIWFKGETRDLLALPDEITRMILGKLNQYFILEFVQFTCKSWYDLLKDPTMWRTIDLGIWYLLLEKNMRYYCEMLLNAIDRVSGQVEAIHIEWCQRDGCKLLIAERIGSSLKRLTISSASSINCEDDFFRMLSWLEVFEMSSSRMSPEVIEALGRNCPLLHTLRMSPLIYTGDVTYTIAENLPNLRHAFIYEVRITVEGLEAMLNSCSLLESLDLRLCKDYSTYDEDDYVNSPGLGCKDLDLRKWPCLLKRY